MGVPKSLDAPGICVELGVLGEMRKSTTGGGLRYFRSPDSVTHPAADSAEHLGANATVPA